MEDNGDHREKAGIYSHDVNCKRSIYVIAMLMLVCFYPISALLQFAHLFNNHLLLHFFAGTSRQRCIGLIAHFSMEL